jgi:4a-hydroxytetrahydrobiopterin dehydratase
MNKIFSERCEACNADAPKLSGEEIGSLLDQVPQWNVIEVDGMQHLVRRFKFKNFVEAISFTNEVGEIAEAENHHPAILTEWGSVQVSWWTHKIKGLHRNDFVMAAKTDALPGI